MFEKNIYKFPENYKKNNKKKKNKKKNNNNKKKKFQQHITRRYKIPLTVLNLQKKSKNGRSSGQQSARFN